MNGEIPFGRLDTICNFLANKIYTTKTRDTQHTQKYIAWNKLTDLNWTDKIQNTETSKWIIKLGERKKKMQKNINKIMIGKCGHTLAFSLCLFVFIEYAMCMNWKRSRQPNHISAWIHQQLEYHELTYDEPYIICIYVYVFYWVESSFIMKG